MATIFGTNTDNTLIVGGDDLRGLGGNDTYIITNSLANNPANANRTIVITDTEGANRLQFADGLQINNVQFLGGNAIQITLTNNLRIQVVGANAFTFDIGGNSVADDNTGLIGRSFTQLAADLGVNLVNGAGTTAAPVTIQPGAAPLAPPVPPVQPYTLTANAPSILEGNAGNSTLSFQLTLDRAATEVVTVNVATNGGTATAGADFIPVANTVTFAVGQTTAFVNVSVVGDAVNELNETVQLTITSPQIVAPVNAVGTITNDDADPAVAPQSFTLQPGLDSFVGAGGNDTFTANNGTFQAGDTLTGAGGTDRLILNDRVTDQAFTNVTSVEVVELASVNAPGVAPAADTIGIFAANAGVQTLRMTVQSDVNVGGFNRDLGITGSIDADAAQINIADAGVKTVDLGANVPSVLDRVVVDGEVNQVRVSFVSAEVGNGSSTNATAPSTAAGAAYNNQAAGGLAVRLEDESATGAVTGEAGDNAASQTHRFEDEGILFTGAVFDVRDVTTLANRGTFEAVALGTNGADTIDGATLGLAGGDRLYINAGAGADTLTDTANADFLVGGGDNDTITTTGGSDSVLGGAGLDTINAGGGNDSLDGGTDDDRFVITSANLDGNDTIIGGAGAADTLAITTGDVTDIQFAGVTLTEVLELADAINPQNASLDILALAAGVRTVNGGATANTITLEQQQAAGNIAIAINGAGGADTVNVVNAVDNLPLITADLGSFNVTISGVENFSAFNAQNGVTATATGATAVNFTDSAAADNFTGGDGNDAFAMVGAVGVTDTMAGGAGNNDTLTITQGTASVSTMEGIVFLADASTRTANVTDNTGATVQMHTNAVLNAGGGNDTVILNTNGVQTVNAAGGDDTIQADGFLSANVRINGGTGANRVTITNAGQVDADFTNVSNVQTLALGTTGAAGTTVTLDTRAFAAGIATVNGSGNLAPGASGASTDDTINVASGAPGSNRVLTIDGGEITANNDTDTVNASGASALTLNVSNVEVLNGAGMTGALTATASGTQAIAITGGTGADILTGSSGNDTLTGGDGKDTLAGGAGNDRYVMSVTQFNTDLDTITEAAGAGDDTLALESGVSVGVVDVGFNARFTNIERVTFSTTAPGGAAEVFTGSFGAFTAQTGLRTFDAGNSGAALDLTFTNQFTGNITVNGGDQADVLNAAAINGTVTYVDGLGGGLADNITTGAQADTVTLVDGNNTVATNGGTDTVNLGAGNDNVNTGAGNDTVNGGGNVTDADVLQGGIDQDTLVLAGTTTLSVASQFAGFENVEARSFGPGAGSFNYSITVDNDNAPTSGGIAFTGAGLKATEMLNVDASAATTYAISVTGGAGNDVIVGGQLADNLTGGEGADVLTGGIGNDAINLTETARVRDTVVLRGDIPTMGLDTIAGFDATNATAANRDLLRVDSNLFSGAYTVVTQGAQGDNFSGVNVVNITAAVAGGVDTAVKVATFLQTSNLGVAGDEKVFFLHDGTDTFVWQYTGDANPNVNATEFTNVAILRGVTGLTTNEVAVDNVAMTGFTTLNDVRTLAPGASYDGLSGTDTLNLTAGAAVTNVANIETVNADAGGSKIITSTSAVLNGAGGVDELAAGLNAGAVTLMGGLSADVFTANNGTTVTITDLGNGLDTYSTSATSTVDATVVANYVAPLAVNNAGGTIRLSSAGFNVDMSAAAGNVGVQITNTGAGATIIGTNYAAGNDTLIGGAGNDTLSGLMGNDQFTTNGGNDQLTGGAGKDTFNATVGGTVTVNDLSGIAANADDDVLVVAAGVTVNATLTGTYDNQAASQNNGGTVNINTGMGNFQLTLDDATGTTGYNVTRSDAGNVRGSAFADTITGSGNQDFINGFGGNDSLVGGVGNDFIDSFLGFFDATLQTEAAGNDTMTGGAGNDTFGVIGTDVITDLSDNDNVVIGATGILNATVTANWTTTNTSNNLGQTNITTAGFDVDLSLDTSDSDRGYRVTNTNGANPTLLLGSNFTGTPGNGDTLVGAGGIDNINGNAGDDSLQGNGGADVIDGGLGIDTIDGGADADELIGGGGNDVMTGGADNDTFRVDAGTDTINDLSDNDVLIVTAGATANATVSAAYIAGVGTVNNGTATLTTNGINVSLVNAGAGNGFTITNTNTNALAPATDLRGSMNADTFNGGAGVDIIVTRDGSDVVTAGGGNDSISNSTADIGGGNDTISGGAGADSIALHNADVANSSERVRYDDLGDFSAAGGAAVVDQVFVFDANNVAAGNDAIVFGNGNGGNLRGLLDDNNNNVLDAVATNLVDAGNDVIGVAGSEVTVLVDAEVEIGVGAFTEANLVSLLGELNEEIDFSGIATGQEHLFIVNVSATQAGLVYYRADAGGDDVILASELRIVGIVNHNDNDNGGNLVAADLGLI